MGVPKFYRWISERYPCLSEVISEQQIPEFDNLYLDMNGIIHNCSHPNDDDITFRITEEQIFLDIFKYIEKLYRIIKPKKVFFMAIDGVAPRAKMNQQRARRFMSARTATEQMAKAVREGAPIPTEKRFDSNCITPGTYFMTKLHKKLIQWVENKINEDPMWQGRRIYLSGHDCPGEGEHKIMDFIRSERALNSYDPNTRHCMYGLDADLIMLGMCSHEPHFSLLREEVKFNRPPRKGQEQKKKNIPKPDSSETTFHLLHLSLLREYLSWEFHSVKESIPFEYDMERVIDDWVLMGYLVGNDFLPHLPHVHIHEDALPLLYSTYKKVLPTLDGYLNEAGVLNLKRFQQFLKQLATNDKNSFLNTMEDENFMKSKKTPKSDDSDLIPFAEVEEDGEALEPSEEPSDELDDEECSDAAFVSSDEENDGPSKQSDDISSEELRNMQGLYDPIEDEFAEALALSEFAAMDDKAFENNAEACWTKAINNSFKRHKKLYYAEKLKYKNISKDQLKDQAEGYIRAIQWNLHYYYHGCASWSWFYPHHYAPYISDVIDFCDMDLTFDLSKPFHPFEQLLAVLPAASADCLPPPLRELMCDSGSPISDFYPTDFQTDLNGKRNDWEAVVLIPFIDEKRLLDAMQTKMRRLTAEELSRNEHGGHQLFETLEQSDSGKLVKHTVLDKGTFCLERSRVVWGLLPNVKLDVYFPGFPTMKHLRHRGALKRVDVSVFGMPSRKESMVLTVVQEEDVANDLLVLASEMLSEEVCIDWPILKIGKVDAICGDGKRYERGEEADTVVQSDQKLEEVEATNRFASAIREKLMSRYAIEAPSANVVVWVRRLIGLTRSVQLDEQGFHVLRCSRQYASRSEAVPVLLPMIARNVLLEGGTQLADLPVDVAYPRKSFAWVLDEKSPAFGSPSMVVDYINLGKPNCRVKLIANVMQPMLDHEDLLRKYEQLSVSWYTAWQAAQLCNLKPGVFSRITGTVFLWKESREKVEKGAQQSRESKINIGLGMKFSRRNLEVADMTKREEGSFSWQYSNLVVKIMRNYRELFPDLFSFLQNSNDENDVYYAEDIWHGVKAQSRCEKLEDFLNNLPDVDLIPCGTKYADRFIVEQVTKKVSNYSPKAFMKQVEVDPANLYTDRLSDGKTKPDAEADFQLLDRVVCIDSKFNIKGAIPGTVIGLYESKVDVIFDKECTGGVSIRSSQKSGFRLPITSLLNLTFALERKNKKPKKAKQTKAKNIKERETSKNGKADQKMDPKPTGPYVEWKPKKKYEKNNGDLKESRNDQTAQGSSASRNTADALKALGINVSKKEQRNDPPQYTIKEKPKSEDPPVVPWKPKRVKMPKNGNVLDLLGAMEPPPRSAGPFTLQRLFPSSSESEEDQPEPAATGSKKEVTPEKKEDPVGQLAENFERVYSSRNNASNASESQKNQIRQEVLPFMPSVPPPQFFMQNRPPPLGMPPPPFMMPMGPPPPLGSHFGSLPLNAFPPQLNNPHQGDPRLTDFKPRALTKPLKLKKGSQHRPPAAKENHPIPHNQQDESGKSKTSEEVSAKSKRPRKKASRLAMNFVS
ncbi:unnamed protein product [Caenorhabditis auriculariae]|uniref:5'-3' exoribonuclease 1 n=1 Tax=Caenorhabditis auriculariae TaxID=2777116 RepID=A0A8S1H8U2_9PELO|nr:unnamed protein product [Caenorhabditis auriculariae]